MQFEPNMKTQLISVILSALLCSTLGHEYLRAHHTNQQAKHARSKQLVSKFRERSNPNDDCYILCPIPPAHEPDEVTIIIIEEFKLVAVLNATSHLGIAFDIEAQLVLLFNGNTGGAVVIDIQAGTGVYFESGVYDGHETLEVFLRATKSLKVILQRSGGVSFRVRFASKVVLQFVATVAISLSADLAIKLKSSVSKSLTLVIDLSTTVIVNLRGHLAILIAKTDTSLIVFGGGLDRFVGVLKGLVKLAGAIKGGLEALLVADVKLKLGLILGAASGIELFGELLIQVAAHVDLSVILQGVISSPIVFLEIIFYLGGGISSNINGVIEVVYHLVAHINKKITINVFIDALIRVGAGGVVKIGHTLTNAIDLILEAIRIQEDNFHNSAAWTVITTFLTNWKEGKLVIGGVDISAVIVIVINGSATTGLDLVTQVLVKITNVVSIAISIPILVAQLILSLTFDGVIIIQKLIPTIRIEIDWSSSISVLGQIVSKVNVFSISRYVLKGDVVGVIERLPVLGEIVVAISGSLKKLNQPSADELLRGQGGASVVIQLKGLVWGLLPGHIGGSVQVGGSIEGSSGVQAGGSGEGSSGEQAGGSGEGSSGAQAGGSGEGSSGAQAGGSGEGSSEVQAGGSGGGSSAGQAGGSEEGSSEVQVGGSGGGSSAGQAGGSEEGSSEVQVGGSGGGSSAGQAGGSEEGSSGVQAGVSQEGSASGGSSSSGGASGGSSVSGGGSASVGHGHWRPGHHHWPHGQADDKHHSKEKHHAKEKHHSAQH